MSRIARPFVERGPDGSSAGAVFIPFHRLDFTITSGAGGYTSAEGVVRVARAVVRALLQSTSYDVVVSARRPYLDAVGAFFREVADDPGRVHVYCVDGPDPMPIEAASTPVPAVPSGLNKFGLHRRWRRLRKGLIEITLTRTMLLGAPRVLVVPIMGAARLLSEALAGLDPSPALAPAVRVVRREFRALRKVGAADHYQQDMFPNTASYVRRLNAADDVVAVFVPHYYLFPEIVQTTQRIVMYLPDHMPTIMPAGTFVDEIVNNAIGRAIAKRAQLVMTNSNYSADYLPRSALKVHPGKIRAFPLPNLNEASSTENAPPDAELGRYRFVLYPTQDRPHKRLSVLASVMARLAAARRGDDALALALTCPPNSKLAELAHPVPVFFRTGIGDAALRSLYARAACLCFTSIAEGNFPPQVTEALTYRVPVVATRMPLITSELGRAAEGLLLVDPDDLDGFARAIASCLDARDDVLARQEAVRELMVERSSWDGFRGNVASLFA